MRYAVDTGTHNSYDSLKEQVLSRLSLDSRYLEEAERALENFRGRRSFLVMSARDLSDGGRIA